MAAVALWMIMLCGIGLFGVITHHLPFAAIVLCAELERALLIEQGPGCLIEARPLDGVNHGGAAEIDVRLKTGEGLCLALNSMVPFDDIDAERGAIEDKFRRTAATLWSPAVVDDTIGRLARFEDEPSVRAFVAGLAGGWGSRASR